MAGPIPKETHERLALHEEADVNDVDTSLISGRGRPDGRGNGYYSDPVFGGVNDNPYRDTTESDCSSLRHMPLTDLIPRPWRTFRQIQVASYLSLVFFLITGGSFFVLLIQCLQG